MQELHELNEAYKITRRGAIIGLVVCIALTLMNMLTGFKDTTHFVIYVFVIVANLWAANNFMKQAEELEELLS